MARLLIIAGSIILVLGLILQFAPWLLNWFGKLPGDIRVESGRSRIFIPITSMFIVSVIVTALINIFRR
ncbi:DUF2905 family protein [Thiogranum longum]|uniref:DUF2905 family protein n=1 Tax=Thiogranum longum TaxID=1537524 RepID=A0A4V2PGV1_9GAMM|nr:DUF2905 domain-containing protein [Thiogranum longum]TCK18256.1 DUF2905 family protein [Thiogranum longum]